MLEQATQGILATFTRCALRAVIPATNEAVFGWLKNPSLAGQLHYSLLSPANLK